MSKSCPKHLGIRKAVRVSEEVKAPAFIWWQGRTKHNLILAGASFAWEAHFALTCSPAALTAPSEATTYYPLRLTKFLLKKEFSQGKLKKKKKPQQLRPAK